MRRTTELKDRWIRGSGALLAYLQERGGEELEQLAAELGAEVAAFETAGCCDLGHPDCSRNIGHLRRLRELQRHVEERRDRLGGGEQAASRH